MSGRQVAGCCAHVAAVIYYLSYAKNKLQQDPASIKCPAVYLCSLFTKTDHPNKPRYVRNKRRKTINVNIESSSSSCGISTDISSDEEPSNLSKQSVQIEMNNNMNILANNVPSNENSDPSFQDDIINVVKMHIPHNGGYFDFNGTKVQVINTCTIDNYLLALWIMSKIIVLFQEKLQSTKISEALKEIIYFIDTNRCFSSLKHHLILNSMICLKY